MGKIIYYEFNLLDKSVYDREKNFASLYGKKSKLPRLSFCLVIFIAILAMLSPEHWIRTIEEKYGLLLILTLGGLIVCATLGTLIFARCPQCKKVQPTGCSSAEGGEGISLSYTKGFTPFRKRCCFCGTYLSVKQLEKDRLKQQNEPKPQEPKPNK